MADSRGGFALNPRYDLLKLTWREAADWVKKDPLVMVPIGSVECEGPHLPLGADFLVSVRIAQAVARETESLVAPGVPYGLCPGFVGFPGTITLRPETLEAVLRDSLGCLMKQGFRRFLLVANHGPNLPVAETAARALMDEYPGTIVASVWPAELSGRVASEMGVPAADRGHGGDPVTSIMLALFPEDVRMDLATADQPPAIGALKLKSSSAAEISGVSVKWYSQVNTWSESGVTGNPLAATAERGQQIFERVCAMVKEVALYLKSVRLK